MKLASHPWKNGAPLIVAFAMLVAEATASAQNGTWTNLVNTGTNSNASGSWATTANWLNSIIASGADNTAKFNTLDISNVASTVTLDGNRIIGNLLIADTVPNTNWTFNAGTPSTSFLTLATSAGSPVINVSNQLATFNVALNGSSGFTKTGGGTLRLNTATAVNGANLSNLVVVSSGILQVGNNNALGTNGNYQSNERVISTNGGTLEIINSIAPNNKHLTLAGTGNGGTNGALYANISGVNVTTRWGLSSWPVAGGASANSSASSPAISLNDDTTIRIDGSYANDPIGNAGASFLIGYIAGTNANSLNFKTLTITGGGRLSFDRGLNGISALMIQGGTYMPNSANQFGSIQYYTVTSGGAVLNNQGPNCFSTTANVQLNGGAFFDLNWRGTGVVGSDTTTFSQNIGYLNGAGKLTTGSRGNTGAQTLVINGALSNSVFSGQITVSNGVLHLTKNGTNTLALSGTNNYNGNTTISAGTWLVDGLHTGGSNYLVAVGATLGGKGTILPNNLPITLNGAGAFLMAGDNGGTLTVSNVVGAGDVIVSNANLTVLNQLNNSGSGSLDSLYLTNSTTTALLQQGGTEASIYTSALNVDGTNNTLAFTSANPSIGQYPFIKYGSIGGLNGFAGLKLSLASGFSASLSNNVANSSIDIVITAIPALVWRGTPTGDWLIGGSANWLNGATPSAYTETAGLGPFVIFDDSATGTAAVNVATNVTPKGIAVSSSTKNYTWSGIGTVSTTGSVVKDGSSTLTLANTNAFSGSVTVVNGALALGNGGTSGNIGTASVANSGQVVFNRSDNVTFANVISGSGSLVKSNVNTVTLTGVGNIGGSIAANGGTLALAPAGTITVAGNVTGGGAFGINSAGKVILTSGTITYTGGSLIAGGTLEFDSVFPPTGSITDNGTLALGTSGTFGNNITGAGGLTLLNGSSVTLAGINSYAGPTRMIGNSTLTADAANYSAGSVLVLGSTNGTADTGAATFTSGSPVLGGLIAGGNNTSPGDPIALAGSSQTLTINGNVNVGNVSPAGASVYLPVTGTGASITVNTNGGVFQIGLGSPASAQNPDNVLVDFSGVDNFTANLGTNGVLNMGTIDNLPGPSAGATVVNQFKLASVSNSITAGLINIGAGGRQLVPELFLGAGTNIFNVNTLGIGQGPVIGGRDGGYLHFLGGTGGLRLRGADGVSRSAFGVGNNSVTGTGASIVNTVDFTGHPVDLLVSTLVIGNYNNLGTYQSSFSFDTGTLDATSTALSVNRVVNANAAASGSSLSIGGGTAKLGPVNLTASAAYGTFSINNATVTVANITSPGTGVATLSINNSTFTIALTNSGNPVTAPVTVDSLSLDGAINLAVNGTNWLVGQFPLFSYTGSIGGAGYPALTLTSLPSGVGGYLSNNIAALSIDLIVTNAPAVVTVNTNSTNIVAVVNAGKLELSWPTDHTGWHLQAQTNSLANGLSTNWMTIPGTDANNHYTNTIDATKPTVFYRLVYP